MGIPIKNILDNLNIIKYHGDYNTAIVKLVPASDAYFTNNTLTWINDKNLNLLQTIHSGTIICSQNVDENKFRKNCNYIIVEKPRQAFTTIINAFFNPLQEYVISKSASIDQTVKLGRKVSIGNNVVIERNCTIGNEVVIDHNTVIKSDTVIKDRVKIGANCTIGGTGFGYEKDEQGNFQLISHIGNVIFEMDVEVGNNTCIDRAVLGSTILRRNSKIDNLVHIAHGVEIGENSVVIANAMIAGSTKIGKNVWVAPSSSIINGINVMDDSLIGLGAVVLKEVDSGQIIVGNPGKNIKQN